MRGVVLTIALVFIALLGVLTVLDFVDNGVTAVGVLAVLDPACCSSLGSSGPCGILQRVT